jgi:NTP pyrophosphatase (non-canonical NTP hydrolase)
MSNAIKNLTEQLIKFRNERDWQQFHKPKELAISLSLEASELLELFQWKTDAEIAQMIKHHPEKLRDELADVFNWILVLSHDCNIDILAASAAKIEKNAQKYPIEKAKGRHTKYTEFTDN